MTISTAPVILICFSSNRVTMRTIMFLTTNQTSSCSRTACIICKSIPVTAIQRKIPNTIISSTFCHTSGFQKIIIITFFFLSITLYRYFWKRIIIFCYWKIIVIIFQTIILNIRIFIIIHFFGFRNNRFIYTIKYHFKR